MFERFGEGEVRPKCRRSDGNLSPFGENASPSALRRQRAATSSPLTYGAALACDAVPGPRLTTIIVVFPRTAAFRSCFNFICSLLFSVFSTSKIIPV